MPVSSTSNCTSSAPGCRSHVETRSFTVPRDMNLAALDTKAISTCRKRSASAWTSDRPGCTSSCMRFPLATSMGCTAASTDDSRPRRSQSSRLRWILFASSRVRSSTALIIDSKSVAACLMRPRSARASEVVLSGSSSSSSSA
ncbi:hypothetical protein D9M68_719050 [compost metagenome]